MERNETKFIMIERQERYWFYYDSMINNFRIYGFVGSNNNLLFFGLFNIFRESNWRDISFNTPILSGPITIRNLEFASILDAIPMDAQVHTRSVNRFNPVNSLTCCNWSPLLVCSTSFVPLYNLRPTRLFLLSYIKALSV